MIKQRTFFSVLLGLLAISGLGIAAMLSRQNTQLTPQSISTSTEPQVDSIAAAEEANSAGLSQQAASAARSSAQQEFNKKYTNITYNFSFEYPESLQVGETTDDSGTTILVQDAKTHVGFQIVVSSWGGGDITADEVHQDIPNLNMRSAQEVSFAGVQALTFFATDANFGDSKQVWFSRGGYLYQISTYSSQDALLQKVLSTWKWQ